MGWKLYISIAGRMNAIVVVVTGVLNVQKQIRYSYTFFYMSSSGNDCELSRIGLLTSGVNILE